MTQHCNHTLLGVKHSKSGFYLEQDNKLRSPEGEYSNGGTCSTKVCDSDGISDKEHGVACNDFTNEDSSILNGDEDSLNFQSTYISD